MLFTISIPVFCLANLAFANPTWPVGTGPQKPCLTDAESLSIATAWEAVWDTGAITAITQLESIVTPGIQNLDETSGLIDGIQALFDTITAPGNYTTTNTKQVPLFLIHSCDQIAVRWEYTAITTGYESTVPVGTPVELKGIDIIHVELSSHLIFNVTSSTDWIRLARQLGETVNI